MTNETKPNEQAGSKRKKNPYEDADPIPTMGTTTHPTRTSKPPVPRSRSVQSARDAAQKASGTPKANKSTTTTPSDAVPKTRDPQAAGVLPVQRRITPRANTTRNKSKMRTTSTTQVPNGVRMAGDAPSAGSTLTKGSASPAAGTPSLGSARSTAGARISGGASSLGSAPSADSARAAGSARSTDCVRATVDTNTTDARTTKAGYTPAATPSAQRRAPKQAGVTLATRRKRRFTISAASIVAAILVLCGLLWWINRPVPITVNGAATQIRIGSTLEDVIKHEKLSLNPGDLVSVGDHVLEAHMGRAYSASLNGQELSAEEADSYRIAGSESIDFWDGGNIVEEFESTSEVIMPYLRMEGSGYSLQYISQWGYAGELQHRKGKRSGETADVVAKEPQDCVITCVEPHIADDQKLVALTFDDGPAEPYTEQYLEILDRYGVKATFFNLGDNTNQYPDLARKVVEKGHQLANHTMAHNQLTSVDAQTVYDEITRSEEALKAATGKLTTHLRPPYGDFTERSWLGSGGSITAAIRWNGDSQDWRTPGADAIISNALVSLHSGTIILMHDGGGDRTQDVEALPRLIEQVQAEGYTFVTIADLMRACDDIPEDICSGEGTMPADATWPEEIHPDDIAAAEAANAAKNTQ